MALAGALACAVAAVPALAQDRDLELHSGGTGLHEIDGFSAATDGATIAFSTFEALVPEDGDDKRDVYLRRNGRTTLVSRGETAGQVPLSTSGAPVVSQDGSRILFVTAEALSFDDKDDVEDVYVWSDGDSARLLSGPASGFTPQGAAAPVALAGGRIPAPTAERAILTTAGQLTSEDKDAAEDLYEVTAAGPRLLTPGTAAGVVAFVANPALTHVAFQSANDLVASDTDGGIDTYLVAGGTYTLLSRGQGAAAAGGPNYADFMSDDGERVVIVTQQALLPVDADPDFDVYLVPRDGPVLLLSAPVSCPVANCRADSYGVSRDLSRVAFTTADRLAPSDTDAQPDVYVWSAGGIDHASRGGTGGNGDVPVLVMPGGRLDRMTADGRGVLFATTERLVAADEDASGLDLYQRRDGETTLVSRGEIDSGAPLEPETSGHYRADAVVFTTPGALSRTDTDTRLDVYAAEAGAAATLISPGKDAFDADLIGANADLSRIFFRTREPLVAADRDEARDLYEARRRPAAPAPPPPGDTTPPDLGLRLSRATFRASSKAPVASAAAKRRRKRTPLGTTIELTLGEAGRVNLALERLDAGRVSKGRCVKPTRRLRRAKRCTRIATPRGRLELDRPTGVTKVAFYGRLPGGTKPRAGRYRLNARAYDAAGNASPLRSVAFTVRAR